MAELNMYKKKVPKKKVSIDFTEEAYQELQDFKNKIATGASNSTIINELILLFLGMTDDMKKALTVECQQQLKGLKQRYAAVSEQEEMEKIDCEIEKYHRLMAFLLPNK